MTTLSKIGVVASVISMTVNAMEGDVCELLLSGFIFLGIILLNQRGDNDG